MKKKLGTSKNIKSSINKDLFKRNETLYGPTGKKYYIPMEKGGEMNCDYNTADINDFISQKNQDFFSFLQEQTIRALKADNKKLQKGGGLPKYQFGIPDGDPFGNPNALPANTPNVGQQQMLNPQPMFPNGTPWTYDMSNPNAPIGNQVYGYNPMMMDPNQIAGMPITSGMSDQQLYDAKGKTTAQLQGKPRDPFLAYKALTALHGIESLQNRGEMASQAQKSKKYLDPMYWNVSMPGGDKGDYLVDTYAGQHFRPNATGANVTPWGNNYNYGQIGSPYFKQGGGLPGQMVVEMTDDEITRFLKNGGTLEYLD